MLQKALWHTDRNRQFVVYEHDGSTVLFLHYLWLEAKQHFFKIIEAFCVYEQTGTVQISVILLSLCPKKQMQALHKIFLSVSSTGK